MGLNLIDNSVGAALCLTALNPSIWLPRDLRNFSHHTKRATSLHVGLLLGDRFVGEEAVSQRGQSLRDVASELGLD